MAGTRKHGHGDGSIYLERSTGKWRGELRNSSGNRQRVSGATRTDIAARSDELRQEMANSHVLGSGDVRLGA